MDAIGWGILAFVLLCGLWLTRLPRPQAREHTTEPGVLTGDEIAELATLGNDIRESLACDENGIGVPCRTDRLFAVQQMLRYCEIHGEIEADADDHTSQGGPTP